jgi:acyl dehydratase
MALDYDLLMNLDPWVVRHDYTARDTMLYALGVGAGIEAASTGVGLDLVYEPRLEALPTMAVVLAYPGFWQKEPKYGLTWQKLLHGEQWLQIHRPLASAASVVGTTRIEEIYDKGADKGAVLIWRRDLVDSANGESLATVRGSSFLRADGGFGGTSEGAPAPHAVPDRAPDASVTLATRPEQALIYRLSGDYNPLHADPEIAAAAGFERPILHGLCTYAVAARGVIALACDGAPSRLRRFDVRFSAPLYPGESLRLELWRGDKGVGAFRAFAAERGVMVLNNGYFEHD